MISEILINGQPSDGMIPATDSSVLRGDGCFEVLKAYGGTPFALDGHLDRLESSAGKLQIPLPPRADIASWIERISSDLGDCAVRVVVTRGSAVPEIEGGPLVIVFGHPWVVDDAPARLYPVVAPWHSAGVDWDLAGAKVISYAPNLSATRRARAEGFDDAVLMTTSGLVLEGPTFSVVWVIDGIIETPTLELGILDSITRRVVLDLATDLGVEVTEGEWGLDRVAEADEVLALSTIREVQVVSRIGDHEFPIGPVGQSLSSAFAELIG